MSISIVIAILIGISINANQKDNMHREELLKRDQVIQKLSNKEIAKKVKEFNEKYKSEK